MYPQLVLYKGVLHAHISHGEYQNLSHNPSKIHYREMVKNSVDRFKVVRRYQIIAREG